MIKLPNGCYCSEPSVYPNNWEKTSASVKKDWYIQYYFYDPTLKDDRRYKYGKRCIIKSGINRYKTADQRRESMHDMMQEELYTLKVGGFNPITKTAIASIATAGEITPETSFIEALTKAYNNLTCKKATIIDIKSVLKYFSQALTQLRYDTIPIGGVKRKHVRLVLDQCGKAKPNWTANQFNHYRRYISMLFTELVELEAIEHNPIREIAKQKTVKRIRQTLTKEERSKVKRYLSKNYCTFWRFVHIFFHSGARLTELLSVKKEDIDLANQRYKCLIEKGKQYKEVWRTIKDTVLSDWKELVNESEPNQYVFSQGLRPGNNKIRREQVTRRWEVHVKKKLGIGADLYSLKHSNTDETTEILTLLDASKMNSHTNTNTTLIYAIGEKERQHNRLKRVQNSFA